MDELATLLNRERLLLELLVFKLVELRQLLLIGEGRFLGWAAEEVERAAQSLHEAELQRGLLVAQLNHARGLEPDALSLRQLAQSSPEPWRTIFEDHRNAFLRLTDELENDLRATRQLAQSGHAAVSEALDRLAGLEPAGAATGSQTYSSDSRWDVGPSSPRFQRTI